MNVLAFGDEEAQSMGINTGRLRLAIVIVFYTADSFLRCSLRNYRLGWSRHPAYYQIPGRTEFQGFTANIDTYRRFIHVDCR